MSIVESTGRHPGLLLLAKLTTQPVPKGISYSPQFCSHQETKMASSRTHRSTSTISRKNRGLWTVWLHKRCLEESEFSRCTAVLVRAVASPLQVMMITATYHVNSDRVTWQDALAQPRPPRKFEHVVTIELCGLALNFPCHCSNSVVVLSHNGCVFSV